MAQPSSAIAFCCVNTRTRRLCKREGQSELSTEQLEGYKFQVILDKCVGGLSPRAHWDHSGCQGTLGPQRLPGNRAAQWGPVGAPAQHLN